MGLCGRFISTLGRVLGGRPDAKGDEELLALKRELASAQLDLQEARDSLAKERARLRATESRESTSVREGVEARLTAVITALAAPLSQLRTQEQLLRTGTAVAASDVMALAAQIERALRDHGLEPVGEPGEEASFDPETMTPMNAQAALAPEAAVKIRFIGYRYSGAVVRKALVEEVK